MYCNLLGLKPLWGWVVSNQVWSTSQGGIATLGEDPKASKNLTLDEKELLKISRKARQFVAKQFSEASFEKGFVEAFNFK